MFPFSGCLFGGDITGNLTTESKRKFKFISAECSDFLYNEDGTVKLILRSADISTDNTNFKKVIVKIQEKIDKSFDSRQNSVESISYLSHLFPRGHWTGIDGRDSFIPSSCSYDNSSRRFSATTTIQLKTSTSNDSVALPAFHRKFSAIEVPPAYRRYSLLKSFQSPGFTPEFQINDNDDTDQSRYSSYPSGRLKSAGTRKGSDGSQGSSVAGQIVTSPRSSLTSRSFVDVATSSEKLTPPPRASSPRRSFGSSNSPLPHLEEETAKEKEEEELLAKAEKQRKAMQDDSTTGEAITVEITEDSPSDSTKEKDVDTDSDIWCPLENIRPPTRGFVSRLSFHDPTHAASANRVKKVLDYIFHEKSFASIDSAYPLRVSEKFDDVRRKSLSKDFSVIPPSDSDVEDMYRRTIENDGPNVTTVNDDDDDDDDDAFDDDNINNSPFPFLTSFFSSTAQRHAAGSGGAITRARRSSGLARRSSQHSLYHHGVDRRRRSSALHHIIQSSLLDSASIAKELLLQLDFWTFDVFCLADATVGRPLLFVMMDLFHRFDYVKLFNLDILKLVKFLNLLEENYHDDNYYHNSNHGADVTQAMHCFLLQKKIGEGLSSLEKMIALIAACSHDIDHPGVNQHFLRVTNHHLALLYDSSLLENHHWRTTVSMLHETELFSHFDNDSWQKCNVFLKKMILATDISRHHELCQSFVKAMETGMDLSTQEQDRLLVLQIAIKCADISNPCRPWRLSEQWSQRVCDEFFIQGEAEQRLGLPVTPFCDSTRTSVPKIQIETTRTP